MADTPAHIKTISLTGIAAKLALVFFIIAFALFAWKAASWQIGSMIGELTTSLDADADRAAAAAVTLAPSDPRSWWLRGASLRRDLSQSAAEASINSIQEAVRLSPYGYRWWAELGRSYEQADDMASAEAAFKKAVSLAPEYTLPNWQLGNFYLRRGRVEEATPPLRIAAKYSPLYRTQVLAIVWNYFNGDANMIQQVVSGDRASVVSLASFYATKGRPEDSLAIWRTLSEEDKALSKSDASTIASYLFQQHRYVAAAEFARFAELDDTVSPGSFTNGDFERGISESQSHLFDWVVARSGSRVDIDTDSKTFHSGKRSLGARFRGYALAQFFDIQQTIAVRPGSRQLIEFWLRTEDLRSGSMPVFIVIDPRSEKNLGVTKPFPMGTNNWQKISVVVDVPGDSDGIRIISAREPCTDECLMAGIFWVDDFRLTELQR